MATVSVIDRIEKLRHQVDLVASECAETLAVFDLPALPPELDSLIDRLRENKFTVLVMGEAKRGKSSFVNAVIGRPLLPVADEVATSQVFRISRAEQAANRLRFEDGSSRPIGTDDLARYGSQVHADAEGAPLEAKDMLRWIEVDVPIKFLPDGISLLDTPGLGSLYAAHGRVTNRFVPMADGVIYVLDADRPMIEDDIKYISTVLDKTSSIFFIMTRIDSYDRDHWQTVQKRDQDILRDRFGNKISHHHIWPISNTNLMKAAETGDRDYIKVSKFIQLSEALQAFLFRVAGLDLTIQSVSILLDHHRETTRVLERQLVNLQEESKERRDANQREIAEWKRAFQEGWGSSGNKRAEISRQVRDIASRGRSEFLQALQPGGIIEQEIHRRIDSAAAVEDIKALAEQVNDMLISRAGDLWQRVTRNAQDACIRLMLPLMEEARTLSFAGAGAGVGSVSAGSARITADDGFLELLKGGRSEAAGVGVVTGGVSTALILAGVSLGPIGWAALGIAGAAATIWGWFQGGMKMKAQQLHKAQTEMRSHVGLVLQTIRNHYQAVTTDRNSLLEGFFSGLENAVNDQVAAIVNRKTNEANAQLRQLEADAELDQRRRAKAIADLQEKIRKWQAVSRSIATLADDIKAIDRELTAAA